MTGPREVFTSTSVGFIMARRSVLIRCRVCAVRVVWRETKSDSREQILQVPVLRREFLLDLGGRPVGVVVEDAHGEPAGTAGQGLPDSAESYDAEGLVMDVLTQHHERPPGPRARERRKRSPSAIRLAAAIIRANAASAVVSVKTSGVLEVRTPCLVQVSTLLLSKPTA